LLELGQVRREQRNLRRNQQRRVPQIGALQARGSLFAEGRHVHRGHVGGLPASLGLRSGQALPSAGRRVRRQRARRYERERTRARQGAVYDGERTISVTHPRAIRNLLFASDIRF